MKIKLIAIFILLMNFAYAQKDTLTVKTSAVCDACKDRIENDLSFVKGISSATLSLETKNVQVIYDPAKITAEQVRKEITMIGYDADSLKADPKAFRKLPDCCKKPHNE
jgi:copper chaperone CopZ